MKVNVGHVDGGVVDQVHHKKYGDVQYIIISHPNDKYARYGMSTNSVTFFSNKKQASTKVEFIPEKDNEKFDHIAFVGRRYSTELALIKDDGKDSYKTIYDGDLPNGKLVEEG